VYFDDELVIDEGTPVAAEFDVAQPV
jgi:hypothetical protein